MSANGFDCRNAMMTKDFVKTVKANDYPEISIRFKNLSPEAISAEQKVLFGRVEITLAGTRRIYPVSCSMREEGDHVKHLEGRRQFHFSDLVSNLPKTFRSHSGERRSVGRFSPRTH